MITQEQFRRGVQRCDGELRPFVQDDWVDQRAYMHDGACGEIAAIWIRNQKFRVTGQPIPSPEERFEEISWMAEQKHKRGQEMTSEFLRGNGLRDGQGAIRFNGAISFDRVLFFIRAQRAYYFFGAAGAGRGHALAASTAGANPDLFDPNYGHARFREFAGFDRFFREFWPTAYPDLVANGGVQRYV